MGIRFHCPNGHKLNVKAFLAGKKGVCPDCGTKFRIPERSEPGLESGIDEAPVPAQLSEPAPAAKVAYSSATTTTRPTVMTSPAPVAHVPASHPAAMPLGPLSPVMPVSPNAPLASNVPRAVAAYPPPPMSIPAPRPPQMAQPMGRPMPAPAVQLPPPPPPPMHGASIPGTSDPLLENPLATWFVRPPSGGQFGPARGEVMRKWITEGRVTSDSLVWREGWTDWLNATEVFPSLGKPAPLFSASPTTKSTTSLPPKKGSSLGVAILIFLAVICVLLVGVLAVVLSGSLSST